MKLLRFDSVGGASGDMILGALIDLGVGAPDIERRLGALPIESFGIRAERAADRGLAGTRVDVDVPDEHHPHRGLAEIGALIEAARLPDRAGTLSRAVFERLAEAEAAVHGTTPDRVHFHEVGAMDSIVDIVGACVALDVLGVDAVTVSALPLGAGSIRTAHGVLPNPAPATVELLKGWPVIATDEPCELVTPTGAALLTVWRTRLPAPSPLPELRVAAAGCGLGHRALDGRANVLRATLFSDAPGATGPDAAAETCAVLECNLDDLVPELLGALTQRLLADGALDVYVTPVQMKKQRPGALLTVLCRPEQRAALIERIFAESTTFGIREHTVSRVVLDRRLAPVQTPYGTVRIKVGSRGGRDVTRSPEHDDCARCAERAGVAVRAVYEAALRAAQTLDPLQ